ncbi:hypothetical protein [Methylorubrum extorquens]|uniref:hypothetical protein n=1 Tax=Methylorubrum extorquens TaxID=408 RepID=UPI000158EFD0|nr:hypothetical protein [Methylorubrum extorquens]ABY30318.1 hypothetical protein Mext_1919 [Methylorubrum extorquens PA1]KQP89256.1 hypothetical protein ASF55_04045 [Methylobacterium sp. Leaf119]WIU41609.1 hypothetical protein KQ926_10080 [Methylorubrum extorquens]
MTPQEINAKVRGAYVRALQSSTMYSMSGSRIDDLFRDVKLYGRDAGTDFAETNLGRIVEEAARMAGCKRPCLEIQVYGWGRAALDGLAQTLRDRTGLKVDVAGPTVRLDWSEDKAGPV